MIQFVIEGTPRPQGSKRHVGNGIMVESSKYVKDWRSFARFKATIVMRNQVRIEKPNAVQITVDFIFDRPKKHFKSNGELRPDAPKFHTSRPDTEKLMRALCDSLTGICFHDDSQVSQQIITKRYGNKEVASSVVLISVLAGVSE